MKTILLFLSVFLISISCFSQSLEGEWNGLYRITSDNIHRPYPTRIRLNFILKEDGSYMVYSNSEDLNFDFVYLVHYKRISSDSIYLEEMRIIEPANQAAKELQKMYLKIVEKKKTLELIGVWESKTWLYRSGEISLVKKVNKVSK